MVRILLHTLLFPPDAAANSYILADLVRELKKFGHEIVVLTTTPHYSTTQAAPEMQSLVPVRGRWLLRSNFEGIDCYHVQVPPVKGGMWTRIRTWLRFHLLGLYVAWGRNMRCDIVLSPTPPPSIGLVGAWIARHHGAKSIFIALDLPIDSLISQGKINNLFFIFLLRALERHTYRKSDAVCSTSAGPVEILSHRMPRETLLREIPNFVNTDLYRPLPRNNHFSESHGLNTDFVVSYVGNLGNAQDFTPVMATARQCADLSVKFLLAGGGIKENALRKEAAQFNLTNLQVLGYQQREMTPWINASSDLCLVLLAPHIRNFSFPSKIYTLMACSKPILLYGHPESDAARFTRETGIGWVVPHGDIDGFVATVRRLQEHREELEEYGNRGIAAVRERFTAQAVALQYHKLIEKLLDKGKHGDAA